MTPDRAYAPGTDAFARQQAERYEATDGRELGEFEGRRVVVLMSVGVKTGMLRKTVLMRVEHGGKYAAVASFAGSSRNPAWYRNLKAHPAVELRDQDTQRPYLARELAGGERARWWRRAVAAYPRYAQYQRQTTRQIPVFLLEPIP